MKNVLKAKLMVLVLVLGSIDFICGGCQSCKGNKGNNQSKSNGNSGDPKKIDDDGKDNGTEGGKKGDDGDGKKGHDKDGKDDKKIITITYENSNFKCNDLKNVVGNEISKKIINEEYVDNNLFLFHLGNGYFSNILNKGTKFVYKNFEGIKNLPFVIAIVELCNNDCYLLCHLNSDYRGSVGFFEGMAGIKKIKILKNGKIIKCVRMFAGCKDLEYLDLSEFDTKEVTVMGGMFNGCSKLENLDLTNFDTTNTRSINKIMFDKTADNLKVRTNNDKIIGVLESGLGMKVGEDGLYKKIVG